MRSIEGVTEVYLPQISYEGEDETIRLIPEVALSRTKDCATYGDFITTWSCYWSWSVVGPESRIRSGSHPWGPPTLPLAFPEAGTWEVIAQTDTVTIHVPTIEEQGGPCSVSPAGAEVGTLNPYNGNDSFCGLSQVEQRCKAMAMAESVEECTGEISCLAADRDLSGDPFYFELCSPPWRDSLHYDNGITYRHPRSPELPVVEIEIRGKVLNISDWKSQWSRYPSYDKMVNAKCIGPWYHCRMRKGEEIMDYGYGITGGYPHYVGARVDEDAGTYKLSFIVEGYVGWKPDSLDVSLYSGRPPNPADMDDDEWLERFVKPTSPPRVMVPINWQTIPPTGVVDVDLQNNMAFPY